MAVIAPFADPRAEARNRRMARSTRCSNPITSSRFPDRPCRKCKACLARATWIWSGRALAEIGNSERTWFATLTFREQPASEADGYKILRKWLDRARKAHPGLRYFVAPEHGTQGTRRLHYHALLHCSDDVSKRNLEAHGWPGHTSFKLVSSRRGRPSDRHKPRHMAKYVAKYATKDGGRRRASSGYGSRAAGELLTNVQAHPLFRAVLDAFPKSALAGFKPNGVSLSRDVLRRALAKSEGADGSDPLPLAGTDDAYKPDTEVGELRQLEKEISREFANRELDISGWLGLSLDNVRATTFTTSKLRLLDELQEAKASHVQAA